MGRTDWNERKEAHMNEWRIHGEAAVRELSAFNDTGDYEHFQNYMIESKLANKHFGIACQMYTKRIKKLLKD